MTSEKRILVVGGGIGGMSSAIALRRDGHAVDLIDLDPQWRVYGAGITITGPSLRAFKALGVFDAIAAHGYTGDGIRVCNVAGERVQDIDTAAQGFDGLPSSGGIMRPVLHRILSERTRAGGARVQLGLTVDRLAEDAEGVDVRFSDGEEGRYDLVVGADGICSRVRSLLFPSSPTPQYSGQSISRVTVKRPPEIDRRHYFLGGPVKVGLTPVSTDSMYMFVLERTAKQIRHEGMLLPGLRAAIADYGGVIAAVRSGLQATDPIIFRPLEGFLLPPPWHGPLRRTLLIGDAAHPTTPHLASGAGMAVEDGLVLADELRRADVPAAMSAFMARRWERCRLVVENSMSIGRLEQQRAPMAAQTELVEQSLRVLAAPI